MYYKIEQRISEEKVLSRKKVKVIAVKVKNENICGSEGDIDDRSIILGGVEENKRFKKIVKFI